MSILKGATNESVKGAAVDYLMNGYSVLPLTGKQPSNGWKVYQTKRAHVTDVDWWESDGLLKNVGIVCGAVSSNLVVIDLDGQEAAELFKAAFGHVLVQTFTVRTGSGLHVYLHCGTLPSNRKIGLGFGHSGIEIRGNGQYVVAPPSIHPVTRKPYEIAIPKPVLRLDGLWDIEKWLDGLETPQKAVVVEKQMEIQPRQGFMDGVVLYDREGKRVRNPKAYARIALSDECRKVARRAHGTRNKALYATAQRMSQFINLGLLTHSEVVRALSDAARSWSGSKQSEGQILATIASGLNSNTAKDA